MFYYDFILFYCIHPLFYSSYFFWLSCWSEIFFCQILLIYNSFLFFKKKNFFKSLWYSAIILIISGFYISLLNFDIFMCFLWVFEFSLFFYLFILLIMFQHNSNYLYTKTWNLNENFFIWLSFFVYFMFFQFFLNPYEWICYNYYYWQDIYYFLINISNDLYSIFLIYYYYYNFIIYIILINILILTFVIISFFKLLKSFNLHKYVNFWKFFNKFLKKQNYENQKTKKSILKLFV